MREMYVRWILVAAGLLGATGIGIGAFTAHGLEGWLEKQSIAPEAVEKRLQQSEVASRYHLLHALAVLAVGLSSLRSERVARLAVLFWLLGVALFCGGLYSMVFLAAIGHWAIVPSGGLCFILGWISVVVLGFRLGRVDD